ncbi:MAG: phosphoenolpyruvate synthase [Candidatus Woesearchaeota archaeon]
MSRKNKFILWFDELGIEDVPIVGGKNASLGEMYRNLSKKKVSIPNGFAITAYAYRYVLKKAGIEKEIKRILNGLNIKSVDDLAERGDKIRRIIRTAKLPDELVEDIIEAYKKLSKQYGDKYTDVAVRSSATAEDLPDASFAGQQETYLNIKSEHDLIDACKKCFASLFTNRAISYRVDKKFDHFKVALSIGVQKMVRSDLSSSGVMFSIDTETGFKDVVLVTSIYGLGENIVQGAVNPDEFYVHKPTLLKGYKSIISKRVGEKKIKMIYSTEGNKLTKNVPVHDHDRQKFSITDKEVLQLSKWAVIIEEHYSKKAGHFKAMDMEWAKDGKTGKLFIVQARPETVVSQRDVTKLEEYELLQKGTVITTGRSVGQKIGAGRAHVIKDVKDINKFKKGEVLVTEMTDPDWEPIMKIAAAIVTDRGGRTCFTGDTKLITNKGFKTFEEVYQDHEEMYVPSLNRETLKIEWKEVRAVMKRKGDVIKVNVSQTGRMKDNCLKLTKDHKVLTFEQRNLIGKEIQNVIGDDDKILIAQKLPQLINSTEKDKKLAYVLGAIMTDGNTYLSRTHGEVQLIQKPTKEKEEFINTYSQCCQDLFQRRPSKCIKKSSGGIIRGRKIMGSANAYRIYSKQIAEEMILQQHDIIENLLFADEVFILHFLAGVIDGDGTFNKKSNKINIYCSNDHLLKAIVISCLRLGIVPNISNNRTIHNVQIVEKVNDILSFTKRVKGTCKRKVMGTRLFSARQLLKDIGDKINYKGRIKTYIINNLLIDAEKIKSSVIPLCSPDEAVQLKKIIDSDTRMLRVTHESDLGKQDVYNIEVEDNHNYIVFTDRYSPLLVNNCHAAIVSRELGIPCIVGTNDGSHKIKSGQRITASCTEGDIGYVYKGQLRFKIKQIDLKNIPKTRTKIMMNLGDPEQAFEMSFLPNDGVGLAREEFIINSFIKIHPKALINFHNLKDKKAKEEIEKLTENYKDKKQFFIDKLAYGVAMIAAGFYPKDVILRFSDFKTNEYANLIGGKEFEPEEDNPMIGWRGASRYYRKEYSDGFRLECKAIRKVREEMGLENLKVMVPFCRTVEEGKKVLKEMRKNGLVRKRKGLEVYVMCEIPSNVILADEFSEIFDGFSIGSNDLTQLTLGLDRDSEIVSDIYDERNMAVKLLIAQVIRVAKANHKKIGICGQAPSDYEDFAIFLVEQGIDSISLNPDTVVKTRLKIAEQEKRMRKK